MPAKKGEDNSNNNNNNKHKSKQKTTTNKQTKENRTKQKNPKQTKSPTPSMHHPLRWNVATSMVGFENGHTHTQISSNMVNSRKIAENACLFVGWLLNVPATFECISGTDLLRQLYVLPH